MDSAMQFCRRAIRNTLLAALSLGTGFSALPLLADDGNPAANQSVGQSISASVNVPSANLGCDDAAAETRVTFNASGIPFEVRRISIFIDGQGLPQSSVEEAWPAVAITKGLHPGRNLVELIAYGPDGQSIDRQQAVLIGVAPEADDVAPAQVACDGGAADTDQGFPAPAADTPQAVEPDATAPSPPPYPEPPPDQLADQPPDQSPDPAQDQPLDQPPDQPTYSYYPQPVFFGPVYSADYFAPPTVYYAPAPPLFFYERRGPRHDGYRPPSSGGNFGRPLANQAAGAATQQRGSIYGQPRYAPGRPFNRPAPPRYYNGPRPQQQNFNPPPAAASTNPRFNAPARAAPRRGNGGPREQPR